MTIRIRRTGECRRCGQMGELRARSLDAACWMAAKGDGTLGAYPLRNRPLRDTAEEYQFLASCGESHEQIAHRLDRDPRALFNAMVIASRVGLLEKPPKPYRTGRAGRPRSRP